MEHSEWFLMKTLRLILLGAVVSEFVLLSTVRAQIYSPRRLTRRIAPQYQTPSQQAPTNAPAQQAPAPATTAPAATTPARPTQTVVRPPLDPETAKAAREEADRKALEFQKKRAEEGSESAQYELGVRYIKGYAVEKDEATARKWLAMSAKNGYSPAKKRLEELDKAANKTADRTVDKTAAATVVAKPVKEDK
jgi:TPR repeat protein